MNTHVYGILHGVIEEKRLIAIKMKHKVHFYYMSKGMFKSFMMYFTSGMYVFIQVQSAYRTYKGYTVQNVVSIDKVLKPNKNNPIVYYDISIIKTGVKNIINRNRNRLFLDFEMSMPPYTNYESFVSEIIQVGFVLTDSEGNVIQKYNSYIKPKLFPQISKRTIKFLQINQEDIDGGIEYREFYDLFKNIRTKYSPMVYVWGKNDQLELVKLNKIHNLKNFTQNMQFVDLLNLHKIYFGLKNDIGLFNAYNMYSNIDLNMQKHDAEEDAQVTKEIFDYFKAVCNGKMIVRVTEK